MDYNLEDETEVLTSLEQSKPYRMHAQTAWILMAIVAVLSIIPFFGFAVWLIAGPILFVSFIMIVLVFAKGGTRHGLVLLACQVIVMPIFVLFGPMVSSIFGLAGGAAAVASTAESQTASPSSSDPAPVSAPVRQDPLPAPGLPPELESLKEKVRAGRVETLDWLRKGYARETPIGMLAPTSVDMPLEIRKAIQQENVWRSEIFKHIAEITGSTSDEVGRSFARKQQQSHPPGP
jgi:hypothetical protein